MGPLNRSAFPDDLDLPLLDLVDFSQTCDHASEPLFPINIKQDEQGMDLVLYLLKINPYIRLSSALAPNHPFLADMMQLPEFADCVLQSDPSCSQKDENNNPESSHGSSAISGEVSWGDTTFDGSLHQGVCDIHSGSSDFWASYSEQAIVPSSGSGLPQPVVGVPLKASTPSLSECCEQSQLVPDAESAQMISPVSRDSLGGNILDGDRYGQDDLFEQASHNASVVVKDDLPKVMQQASHNDSVVVLDDLPEVMQQASHNDSVVVLDDLPGVMQQASHNDSVVVLDDLPEVMQQASHNDSVVVLDDSPEVMQQASHNDSVVVLDDLPEVMQQASHNDSVVVLDHSPVDCNDSVIVLDHAPDEASQDLS